MKEPTVDCRQTPSISARKELCEKVYLERDAVRSGASDSQIIWKTSRLGPREECRINKRWENMVRDGVGKYIGKIVIIITMY